MTRRQAIENAVKVLLDARKAEIEAAGLRKVVITVVCSPNCLEPRDAFCSIESGDRRKDIREDRLA